MFTTGGLSQSKSVSALNFLSSYGFEIWKECSGEPPAGSASLLATGRLSLAKSAWVPMLQLNFEYSDCPDEPPAGSAGLFTTGGLSHPRSAWQTGCEHKLLTQLEVHNGMGLLDGA